jgi:hypothetical protein
MRAFLPERVNLDREIQECINDCLAFPIPWPASQQQMQLQQIPPSKMGIAKLSVAIACVYIVTKL